MKAICSTIVILLLGATLFAQGPIKKGDYIMVTQPILSTQNYIAKSNWVYYGYDTITQKTENKYKTTKARSQELFSFLEQIDFDNLEVKTLDQAGDELLMISQIYRIDYRRGSKTYSYYWVQGDESTFGKLMLDIMHRMNGYW